MKVLFNGKAKVWTDDIEDSALVQIENITKHPYLFNHIAIMADCHFGSGAPIGSVIATKGAIIPAAVGVDIGCGMCAVKTNLRYEEIKEHRNSLYRGFKERIPRGFNHRTSGTDALHAYLLPRIIEGTNPTKADANFLNEVARYQKKYSTEETCTACNGTGMTQTHPDCQPEECPECEGSMVVLKGKEILPQLGTLGGGNHFIELQKDTEGFVWIMIHSGSRNIGHTIATNYMNKAKESVKEKAIKDVMGVNGGDERSAKKVVEKCLKDSPSPIKGIEPLIEGTKDFKDYIEEQNFALEFAMRNREIMMACIKDEISNKHRFPHVVFEKPINIHHNYVTRETHFGKEVWVHRKGATSALVGQKGIIPGSMASNSYIVTGEGNPESYNSCSHGAGRIMSRTAAKGKRRKRDGKIIKEGRISLKDFEESMVGIYSEQVDFDHLDEARDAYKKIHVVMANQIDLVSILVELTPVLSLKG